MTKIEKRHIPASSLAENDRATAKAEERELEKQTSQHSRDQRTKQILWVGILVLICIVFLFVACAIVAVGWHLLTPERLHWLGNDALDEVRSFLLSGAVVGVGTSFLKKYLESDNR